MLVKITSDTIIKGKVASAGEYHDVDDKDFRILTEFDKAVITTEEEREKAIKEISSNREASLRLNKRVK